MLEKEFKYYLDHQTELVPKYDGKYVMIVGENVVGAFSSLGEACYKGKSTYGAGNFLLQLCTPGESAYTIRYHSRPAFTLPPMAEKQNFHFRYQVLLILTLQRNNIQSNL